MINLSFFRRHPSDTTSEKDDPGDGEETRSSYPVLAGIVAALREAGRRSVARKPLAVTTQAFARFRPFRVVRVRVVRDGGRGFLPAGSEKTCKQTLFYLLRDQRGTRRKPAVVGAKSGNKTCLFAGCLQRERRDSNPRPPA